MSIDEEGYLSQDIEKIRKNLEEKFKSYFDICFELNKFCQKLKFELGINNKDGKKVLASCFFIKIINGFQSIVILTRYGFVVEAEIILRTIVEAFILSENICKKENFLEEYIRSHQKTRLRIIKDACKSNSQVYVDLKNHMTSDIKQELEDEICDEKIKEPNIYNLAKNVGYEELYNVVYRLSSGAVHSNPYEMEKYCICDDKHNITDIIWGPKDKDISKVICTTIGIVLMCLRSLCQLFNLDKKDEIDKFHEKLKLIQNIL